MMHSLFKNNPTPRRSLKRRIRKMMTLTNNLSVFFACVFMFFGVQYLTQYYGASILTYSANQLALVIEQQLASESSTDLKQYLSNIDPRIPASVSAFIEADAANALSDLISDPQEDSFPGTIVTSVLDYRVWINGKEIFDSFPEQHYEQMDKLGITRDMLDRISGEVKKPLVLDGNDFTGTVSVRFNPIVILLSYVTVLGAGGLLLLINALVVRVLSSFLTRAVIRPIHHLNREIDRISEGLEGPSPNEELTLKRPVWEIFQLMTSTNKVMHKMNDYNRLLEAHKDELEAQKDELEAQNDALAAQNTMLSQQEASLRSMNDAYIGRTLKLQNLLNNVGQGFMTISHTQRINSEYSSECDHMLQTAAGHSLYDMDFSQALFGGTDDEDFVRELLIKIFECDPSQQELYISLLPEEVIKNGRTLHIAYKLVSDELHHSQLLIILTDMTQTRTLQEQIVEERNRLNMIVKALVNREEFVAIVKDYQHFFHRQMRHGILDYEQVVREIHTFKGSFSQYDMNATAASLQLLEDRLLSCGPESSPALDGQDFSDALIDDLAVLDRYVDKDFWNVQNTYAISESRLNAVESAIRQVLPAESHATVLSAFNKLRFRSLKSLIGPIPDYTGRMALKMNKRIYSFDIEGDDIYVDSHYFQPLVKNLVHLFRNAVAHGIEPEDVRIGSGKDGCGTIGCVIQDKGADFEIEVYDDGFGMDPDVILRKAIERRLITREESKGMSEAEKLGLIFSHGFSTQDEASALSGRGVGLTALKDSVEQLNGRIELQAIPGKGSQFKISLPHPLL